jgi:cyanate permease
MSVPSKRVDWSALAVLATLAGLVVFGVEDNGFTGAEALVPLGFGAAVLLLAWLWQRTCRQAAESGPELSRKELAWNVAVFMAFLAVVGLLVWRYVADRQEQGREGRTPVGSEPE